MSQPLSGENVLLRRTASSSPRPACRIASPSGAIPGLCQVPRRHPCGPSGKRAMLRSFTSVATLALLITTCGGLGIEPARQQAVETARWLVHRNSWGVVATVSRHLQGVPFGNVASYSDGKERSTGRLIFYLTKLDATAYDVEVNCNATVTVSQAQLPGACGPTDPEDPTCTRISLTGPMLPVPEAGLREAMDFLFARHPQMQNWPSSHGFAAYELHAHAIRLLDSYGGPKDISPAGYYGFRLS